MSKRSPAPKRVRDYRSQVELCSAFDIAGPASLPLLVRETIYRTWAAIAPAKGQFFMSGAATEEGRNDWSHGIHIRWRPDIDITGYAWVYEQRLKTGGRWFKVLRVKEVGERQREWELQCRLAEKGDDLVQPAGKDSPLVALPEGVEL